MSHPTTTENALQPGHVVRVAELVTTHGDRVAVELRVDGQGRGQLALTVRNHLHAETAAETAIFDLPQRAERRAIWALRAIFDAATSHTDAKPGQ